MKQQYLSNLFFLFLLCCTTNLWGQYVPMDIPLVRDGRVLLNPWAGGMNLPQFSEVDLNRDGIKDLVVFDRDASVVTTFINRGTAGQVDYHYAPEYMHRFPKDIVNFMLLRDYNCDGIQDIVGMYYKWAQGAGVAVWQGSYDANDTIQFTMVLDQARYDMKGQSFDYKLFVYNTDLPAIDDIDGDGDLDILAFTQDFSFPQNVFWYKNTSVENGFGCDSLHFVLETQCWGLFQEIGDSNIVDMSPSVDSCYNNPYYRYAMDREQQTIEADRNLRHVGANLTTVDINNDGIKEMVLGGVSFRNINMISGQLVNDTILINAQDYHFPSYDVPVDIFSFVSTYFIDVNNDGKTDMIAAPSELGNGEAVKDSVAWYYQNVTNNNNMVFNFQQKDFLVGDMLDVGDRAFPTLFDFNGDGLMDMVIGHKSRPKDGGGHTYGLTLLKNTGTLGSPAFELVDNNYANLGGLNKRRLYPTFGDLDGDGDMDMICGTQTDSLIFVENIAPIGSSVAVWGPPVRRYMGISVGSETSPQLIDLDRDGDLDLVVGTYIGDIRYYENKGTASSPAFSSIPTSSLLGGHTVQTNYSRSSMPHIFENSAGQYEMLVGHDAGNFIHLGNIDGNILGVYDTLSENFNDFYFGTSAHISTADLDNNGEIDFIIGMVQGGVSIRTLRDTFTTISSIQAEQKILNVYPNPTQDKLTINFLAPTQEAAFITIYNALGQVVLQTTQSSTNQQYQLDVSSLAAGLFFLDINSGKYKETVRFVKR